MLTARPEPASRRRRAATRCILTALLAAACGHGDAFQPGTSPIVGPYSSVLPRRLTFYALADWAPSVHDGMLVFSRQSDKEPGEYGPDGREQCVAFMPVEGGSVSRLLCPDRLIPQPDTFVDTWFDASLSPDGKRLAFMWQRGTRISALGWRDAYLMVTPADRPQDTTAVRLMVDWVRPDTPNVIHGTVATHITWLDSTQLRFLATYEHIRKVKGGGSERVTDTTYEPLALMRLDLASGVISLVPGGDSVTAYAPAPSGGLWVVKALDPALRHLDPATGALTVVGHFTHSVFDLINVDGSPVGIVDSAVVERLNLTTGAVDTLGAFTTPVHRLAAAGGRRFVVEVEQAIKLFGAPQDLYLLELP